MKDRVTIKDIAEATGFSPSTVSRIINKKGKYAQETQQTVWDAVQELKYSPNLMAKSLRSKKSALVGILIPTINDDYFGLLADNLAQKLIRYNFSPMICPTYNDEVIEARYCSMLAASDVCGIIYVLKDTPVHETCISVPSIFIGSAPESAAEGVRILFDMIGGARKATEELLNAGCRRIVYIEAARHRQRQLGRSLGYQQALWENGVSLDEDLVVTIGGQNNNSIGSALEELIDRKVLFDGIFSNKLSTSIEVLNTLKKRGIKVPQDVKMISFENGRSAELYTPGISSIGMDSSYTSEAAVSALKEMIDQGQPLKRTVRVPAVLYRRETTAAREG
jgi:LacI family transcriptional regulator